MGRERAFTAKVVMLEASRRVKLGPSELLDPAIGNCFAAEFRCEVTTVWSKRGKFMECLAVGSAVIGLMFLISWPSAFAAGQQGLSLKVFTSPAYQIRADSGII